jgi:hypothetical protein
LPPREVLRARGLSFSYCVWPRGAAWFHWAVALAAIEGLLLCRSVVAVEYYLIRSSPRTDGMQVSKLERTMSGRAAIEVDVKRLVI